MSDDKKLHKKGPLKGLPKLSPAKYVWRGSGLFSVFSNFLYPNPREFGNRELAEERRKRMQPIRDVENGHKRITTFLTLDKELFKLQKEQFDDPHNFKRNLRIFWLTTRIKFLFR